MCLPFVETYFSGILLNKHGLKTIARDDKVIIYCNRVFIGKGCMNGSLFVLNFASETINENASNFTYAVEYINLYM